MPVVAVDHETKARDGAANVYSAPSSGKVSQNHIPIGFNAFWTDVFQPLKHREMVQSHDTSSPFG